MSPEEFIANFDPDLYWFPDQKIRMKRAASMYERIDFDVPGGCWIWTGGGTGNGHGVYNTIAGLLNTHVAHRQIYQLFEGKVPKTQQVDHLCRVPRCVNPHHLEPVTPKENIARALEHKATCVNGHPYTEENRIPNGEWTRCRICHRDRERERSREKRAKEKASQN